MGKLVTIYLRSEVEKLLGDTPPGPIMNDLVVKHYKGTTPPIPQEVANAAANMKVEKEQLERSRTKAKDNFTSVDPGEVVPFNGDAESPELAGEHAGEQPCCLKSNPCKHWMWDGNTQMWKNSLSGRTRVNE